MNSRQKGLQAVLAASALLYRQVTPQERLEAARALGIEDWLPEPTQEEMELKGESKDGR